MSDRVAAWTQAYARAWQAGDAEGATALFTEDCPLRSTPFRAYENAREYTRRVFAEEGEREIWFGAPVGEGDRVAVEYWAAMIENGAEVTLAGCCVFRLDGDGLCTELRDYWAMHPGRRPPNEGWGR